MSASLFVKENNSRWGYLDVEKVYVPEPSLFIFNRVPVYVVQYLLDVNHEAEGSYATDHPFYDHIRLQILFLNIIIFDEETKRKLNQY